MKKFLLCICIFVSTTTVFADTTISNIQITKPTVWTKSKSPYVLDGNVHITGSGSLTVEAGVILKIKNGNIFSAEGGKLYLSGTEQSPIMMSYENQVSTPFLQGLKTTIRLEYVEFSGFDRRFGAVWNHSELYFDHVVYNSRKITSGVWLDIFGYSKAIISNSIISGWRGVGIEVFDSSELTLTNSNIEYSNKGVYVFFNSSSTIEHNVFSNNQVAVQVDTPNVSMHLNDFENNRIHVNSIQFNVDAVANWWGSSNSPRHVDDEDDVSLTDSGILAGPIGYVPISVQRHKTKSVCCSSILFFPGLMGSRLYVKSSGFENQLWEPNRNLDVKKLYLNAAGESALAGIYTKDIINRTNIAFGLPYIDQSPYKDFSQFMDKLVKDKTISSWKPLPYDWRFSPDTLLQLRDIELENTIITLAQKSQTKKVTLISHSNGGFLIKQLMARLKLVGIDHYIDKIIFVAFPEYGTPQAITSLMFGHEQSIGNGLILKSSIAKELGKNMPTAYTLLPSSLFFESGRGIQLLQDISMSVISLRSFLSTYSKLNTELLERAKNLHEQLDSWIVQIPVFQIVGTGLPTVSGIQKINEDDFIPMYTNTGDGMVPDMFNELQRNFTRSGITLAIDLTKEKGVRHMNIMNSLAVQKQISSIIKNGALDPGLSNADVLDIRKLPFSYNLAKVSASSSKNNLILKQPVSNDLYALYENSPLISFDSVTETDSLNRFELWDQSVLYLNMNSLEKLTVLPGSGMHMTEAADIDLLEKEGTSVTQTHYEGVLLNPTFGLSVQGAVLAIQLDEKTSIHIEPDTKTVFDDKGNVISQTIASTTRDLQKEAAQIRTEMIRNITSDTLRQRYLVRLNAYAATGDIAYLKDVRARIQRAIESITRFDNNPALKARYARLKVDYQFLSYMFYYISPDRPAGMRFVSL